MSTKIYDGLIAMDRNPFRVQSRIKNVLEPIFLAKFDAATDVAMSNAGKNWSDVFPALFPMSDPKRERWNKPIPASRFEMADQLYSLIVDLYEGITRTFSDLDFGYEVILLPNGRGIAHRPLVLVFSERAGDEYREALIGANVVEDYGYWNNTDEPDDMDMQEWEQRRRAWDKLDTPRVDGLTIAMPSRITTAFMDRN